jgi:hypothetical protein
MLHGVLAGIVFVAACALRPATPSVQARARLTPGALLSARRARAPPILS